MFDVSTNIVEAYKAKEEYEKVCYQTIGKFEIKENCQVINHILSESRKMGSSAECWQVLSLVNFGYILGIRAERAKKRANKKKTERNI